MNKRCEPPKNQRNGTSAVQRKAPVPASKIEKQAGWKSGFCKLLSVGDIGVHGPICIWSA